MKQRNPYKKSYIWLVAICCLAFGIVFMVIQHMSNQEARTLYYQKKAELFRDDLEVQAEIFEQIALQIKIDNTYKPVQFRKNKYNEKILLDDFVQYSHYSAMTDECFLYYGGDYIFHSSGNTVSLNAFLRNVPAGEGKDRLLQVLSDVEKEMQGLQKFGDRLRVLSVCGDIYIFVPFSFAESSGTTQVALGFVISHEDLTTRLRMISGGLEGNISIYAGKELLYTYQEPACREDSKNVLTATSAAGAFSVCYLPDGKDFVQSSILPLQILLLLTDLILLILIANTFAQKTYRPIQELTDKYREKTILIGESQHENALTELNYIMDRVFQNNVLINKQIQQKQEMLQKLVLGMLLNGNDTFDIPKTLKKLKIPIHGPYYFVMSLSYEDEEEVTEEFLESLQNELEQIMLLDEENVVQAVCDYSKNCLSVVCSIQDEEQKKTLISAIRGTVMSYEYEPFIGVGNTYNNLSRVSASWLESMDLVHKKMAQQKVGYSGEDVSHSEDLYRITASLSKCDEDGAIRALEHLVNQLKYEYLSLLMQKNIFADFLVEISKIAKKYEIELSSRQVSLIISANNMAKFQEAAQDLIHDFCMQRELLDHQFQEEESYRIYKYVNAHFAEYDLSIERIAEELNTSAATVRQAVLKHTGKLYRDYIIHKRVEYAKILLLKEEMSVAETCQHVGYTNISHFIKAFKQLTGVTPAKYKRTAGNDALLTENGNKI